MEEAPDVSFLLTLVLIVLGRMHQELCGVEWVHKPPVLLPLLRGGVLMVVLSLVLLMVFGHRLAALRCLLPLLFLPLPFRVLLLLMSPLLLFMFLHFVCHF